jgi:hypothetical protein
LRSYEKIGSQKGLLSHIPYTCTYQALPRLGTLLSEVPNTLAVEAQKNLPQQAMELEVEQPAAGRLEGVGSPVEVDGDSTIEMEGDLVVA